MTTSPNPLADQAEQLARREARETERPHVPKPYQWRNLVLSISMGMDTRPLAGAVGTRINGERRLVAAFGPDKEKP